MQIVIFTGGDFPHPDLEREFFHSNKPDFVIAADSGLSACEKYIGYFKDASFEPDVILGDWDSIEKKDEVKKFPSALIENFPVDKDWTDTELALNTAYSHFEKEKVPEEERKVILVGAGGGERIDHLLAVFDLFSEKTHPDIWLGGKQSIYFLPEGKTVAVENLALDDVFSVLRTSRARRGGKIFSEGLLWPHDKFRNEGLPSLSNRISPEFFMDKNPVKLTAIEGDFVAVFPYSANVKICNAKS